MLHPRLAADILLRVVAAAACFTAAALALTQPELDVRDLHTLAETVPAQRIRLLQQAHQVHPRDTPISLQLGLELERAGDLPQAEVVLLQAARFDRQYQPAWTLANFYFRRGNREQFWLWAERAASINEYDLRPLLRLANVWAPEPVELVARLGDRPKLLRPYLDVLIGEARFSDAQKVALLLRGHRDPADLPRLEALDRSLPEDLRIIRSAASP
jgi:tetratricopeptide (TPR) repeat protein